MAKRNKKLTVAQKKWQQKLNIEWLNKVNARRRAAFNSTTLDQRKAFVQGLHDGKSISAASAEAGISKDASWELVRRYHKEVKYHVLIPVSEVK